MILITLASLSLFHRTPAMIGCSFVVNRKFFGEIGLLDPGMDVYGGENIELGIKVCDMVTFALVHIYEQSCLVTFMYI